MIEKRFYIEDEHIKDKLGAYNPFYVETYKEAKRFCDFLNDLNQEVIDAEHYHTVVLENFKAISNENEQLKKDLKLIKKLKICDVNEMLELQEKNEQLKQELQQCKAVIDKEWKEYVEKEMNKDDC